MSAKRVHQVTPTKRTADEANNKSHPTSVFAQLKKRLDEIARVQKETQETVLGLAEQIDELSDYILQEGDSWDDDDDDDEEEEEVENEEDDGDEDDEDTEGAEGEDDIEFTNEKTTSQHLKESLYFHVRQIMGLLKQL